MREWLWTWATAVPDEAVVMVMAGVFAVLAVVFAIATYRAWCQVVRDEADAGWPVREGGLRR